MEIFINIVTLLWFGLAVGSFVFLMWSIFDVDCEKKDVVRSLGAFVVAAITAISLISMI